MKRRTISAMVVVFLLGAVPAFAQGTKDSAAKGDVATGSGGDVPKEDGKEKRYTQVGDAQKLRRSEFNDDFYDSVAGIQAPSRNRTIPWGVGLVMAGAVLFTGLKHSFRNRYEG